MIHLFFLFSAVRRPFPHFTDTLKSQTSLTLLLKHYELTNEKVSCFLTNQSKTKTFIELKVTRKPKPTKNSTRPFLYEIPAHFTRYRQKVMTSSALIYSTSN